MNGPFQKRRPAPVYPPGPIGFDWAGEPEVPDNRWPIVGLNLIIPDLIQEHLLISVPVHVPKIGTKRGKRKAKDRDRIAAKEKM